MPCWTRRLHPFCFPPDAITGFSLHDGTDLRYIHWWLNNRYLFAGASHSLLPAVFSYTKTRATSWLTTIISTIVITIIIYFGFQTALGIGLYPGLFVKWLGG
jgi:hypothetical protein